MSNQRTEITGHRVTFCVHQHAGRPIQHLTILPGAFLDYGDCRREADYVQVEMQLVVDRSQSILDEHMTVGSLLRLHDHLMELQNGGNGTADFGTVDGLLELTVASHKVTGDVHFTGKIPAFDPAEIKTEPLRLRRGIYRTETFQFALEPASLDDAIAQLAALLELLRSLKPPAEVDVG